MRHVLTALAIVVGGLGFVNFFTGTIPVYYSHPPMVLAFGFLVIRRLAPARMLRRTDPPPPLTGAPLATARCSGAIGGLRIQNLLRVTGWSSR